MKIKLDLPFIAEKRVEKVNVNRIDLFTQSSFIELIEESYRQTTNYIIAIASDILGNISFIDGCSFVRYSYINENSLSALTRKKITAVAFYTLPVSTIDEIKNVIEIDQKQEGDSFNSENFPPSDSAANIQFKYICSLDDVTRASSKEWFLSFIAAHDLNKQDRAREAFKIALIYQAGADSSQYKITDNVVKKFFKKNQSHAFYWHLQSAKLNWADSFYYLSYYFDKGEVCPQSSKKAFQCMKKAVELAPHAIDYLKLLAHRYHKGMGTTQDTGKAMEIVSRINMLKAEYALLTNLVIYNPT